MFKRFRFVPAAVCLGLVCALAVMGCQKVTAQAKAALTVAVGITKARAVAFAALQCKITAKDPVNAAKIALFVSEHGNELNQLADAMCHLNDAVVNSGSALDDVTRQAVWEEARTSAVRAVNFKLIMKFMAASDDLVAHQAGLVLQAQVMQQLAELLPLKNGSVFVVTSNTNVSGGL